MCQELVHKTVTFLGVDDSHTAFEYRGQMRLVAPFGLSMLWLVGRQGRTRWLHQDNIVAYLKASSCVGAYRHIDCFDLQSLAGLVQAFLG